MPDRELLETYPLFRAKQVEIPEPLYTLVSPSIKMFCPLCDSEQTYKHSNTIYDQHDEPQGRVPFPEITLTPRLAYKCASCDSHRRYFLVAIDKENGTVTKTGQSPPPQIQVSKAFERRLGLYAGVYKKGLMSESHGFGIGAFAYYRRVVENVIDALLKDIEALFPVQERATYEAALAQVAKTHVTERKIELVKDLLPSTLRPDGMNPLGALHSALSEGLHAQTDEECLESAETLRVILVYLVSQVDESRAAAKTFTEGMRKVLGPRGKKD